MTKTYKVPEAKIEELRKRIARIQKKCNNYNQDFHFAEVGETIEEIKRGSRTYNVKFILVEASGTAVINNWEFVATIDHTPNGNIINKGFLDIEVPTKYRESTPICEHCGSSRYRKETYIVHNIETNEFKQVGRSCLKDYTHGMDAAHIATLMESLAFLEESESFDGCSFQYVPKYYEPKKYLQYVIETVKNFGYVKSSDPESTRARTDDFFYLLEDNWAFSTEYRETLEDKIREINYKPYTEENLNFAEQMIAWVNSVEDNTDYLHNLRTIFSSEYVSSKYFGYIAGLVPTYNKAVVKLEEQKKEEDTTIKSVYQGSIGDKLSLNIADVQLITSWDTQWGTTYIYKFIDTEGNIFTWKTSNWIRLDRPVKTLKGTVKDHTEYRGVQQTELTRCKIA